jgi:hypothetical protein
VDLDGEICSGVVDIEGDASATLHPLRLTSALALLALVLVAIRAQLPNVRVDNLDGQIPLGPLCHNTRVSPEENLEALAWTMWHH